MVLINFREIRDVCRIILHTTKKYPNLFTLPGRSAGNFILKRFLVCELRYRSKQCSVAGIIFKKRIIIIFISLFEMVIIIFKYHGTDGKLQITFLFWRMWQTY